MNIWQKIGLILHESDPIDSFCGKLKINRIREISEKIGDKYLKIRGNQGYFQIV
jgi:hypothetical protein